MRGTGHSSKVRLANGQPWPRPSVPLFSSVEWRGPQLSYRSHLLHGEGPVGPRTTPACSALWTQANLRACPSQSTVNSGQWLQEIKSRNYVEKRWSIYSDSWYNTNRYHVCERDGRLGIRLRDLQLLFHLMQQSPELGVTVSSGFYRWGDCLPRAHGGQAAQMKPGTRNGQRSGLGTQPSSSLRLASQGVFQGSYIILSRTGCSFIHLLK